MRVERPLLDTQGNAVTSGPASQVTVMLAMAARGGVADFWPPRAAVDRHVQLADTFISAAAAGPHWPQVGEGGNFARGRHLRGAGAAVDAVNDQVADCIKEGLGHTI